jgi:energy-coupling factor transporter transmembrane protein EcfT
MLSEDTSKNEDSFTVPFETRGYFSERKAKKSLRIAIIAFIAVLLLTIILGRYLTPAYFFGPFFMLFLIVISINLFKNYRNRQPQIVLNDKGIQTVSTPFYPWEYIKGESVLEISESRTTGNYLVYDYPNGSKKLSLSFLETNKTELQYLLMAYRKRNEEMKLRNP